MMEHRNVHGVDKLAELAFGMRPAEELYDLKKDPEQMRNVAGLSSMVSIQQSLRERLFKHLRETEDPRVTRSADDWDYYPYYGRTTTKGWAVDPKPNQDS